MLSMWTLIVLFFLPIYIFCHMCCFLDMCCLLEIFVLSSYFIGDFKRRPKWSSRLVIGNFVLECKSLYTLWPNFLCNCFSICIGVLTWNLPKGEIVRFLVVVGIYFISKRVYLVMFMWSYWWWYKASKKDLTTVHARWWLDKGNSLHCSSKV